MPDKEFHLSIVSDEAANHFAVFPPDYDNLTPDYLKSHGVRDGVRDFTPVVGRFSRERWRSNIFPVTQDAEQPTMSSVRIGILVEVNMRLIQLRAENLGFTVGHHPHSVTAAHELRENLREFFRNLI